MAFKKYLTADNVHAQLDGNVNTTQTQIVFKNGANVPTAGNWIATLVQYGQDGFPSKWEKVLVTGVAGQILTVQRAYDGSTAQTFNDNDYVFLNVVSEIIKDIQDRIDELGTSLGNYQLTSQKNQANGYAGLGADGKIDVGQIPALKSHEFLTVTNAAARYALTTSQVQVGDEVLETSTGETYVLIASDPSQAGSWLFKSDTTPTWSSIAGKPTTIAGFGIVDAYTKTESDNVLIAYAYSKTASDARYSQLGHTHDFASITSNPTTLSGYGITDAVTTNTGQTITGQKNFTGGVLATDFNNRNVLYLLNAGGALKWYISHHTDFHLTESGVADYRFIVKAGGNVGIGIDPAARLDVNGTMRMSGLFTKEYQTGGSGSTCRFGSRYELSGITHGNQGHILQWVWGDAWNIPESSSIDGGYGMEFGAHGNPYLKMIAFDVYIGRSDGKVIVPYVLQIKSPSDQGITFTHTDAYSSHYWRNYQGSFYWYHQTPSSGPTTVVTGGGYWTFPNQIRVGNSVANDAGSIRWNGSKFQGYTGSAWVDFH